MLMNTYIHTIIQKRQTNRQINSYIDILINRQMDILGNRQIMTLFGKTMKYFNLCYPSKLIRKEKNVYNKKITFPGAVYSFDYRGGKEEPI